MATSIIRKNDSGVIFNYTVQDELGVVNLTSVQSLVLYFQKPDGSIMSRNCSTVSATLGQIRYICTATDFDQAGKWNVQLVVRFANNNVKHSNVTTLVVSPNIAPV